MQPAPLRPVSPPVELGRGSHQHSAHLYHAGDLPTLRQQLGQWGQWEVGVARGGLRARLGSQPCHEPTGRVLFLTDVLSLSHSALTRRMSLLSPPTLLSLLHSGISQLSLDQVILVWSSFSWPSLPPRRPSLQFLWDLPEPVPGWALSQSCLPSPEPSSPASSLLFPPGRVCPLLCPSCCFCQWGASVSLLTWPLSTSAFSSAERALSVPRSVSLQGLPAAQRTPHQVVSPSPSVAFLLSGFASPITHSLFTFFCVPHLSFSLSVSDCPIHTLPLSPGEGPTVGELPEMCMAEKPWPDTLLLGLMLISTRRLLSWSPKSLVKPLEPSWVRQLH